MMYKQREQNDIALLEVNEPFDFSKRADVGPICLANSKIQVNLYQKYLQNKNSTRIKFDLWLFKHQLHVHLGFR